MATPASTRSSTSPITNPRRMSSSFLRHLLLPPTVPGRCEGVMNAGRRVREALPDPRFGRRHFRESSLVRFGPSDRKGPPVSSVITHSVATFATSAPPPARGAQLGQVIPASVVAVILLAVVAWLSVRHRRGTFQGLKRASAFAERVSGLPGWASLPTAVATVSLIVAAFGFYWDVSWHIDRGRDPGPFSNPAHFFIIFGLLGTALAGWMAVL